MFLLLGLDSADKNQVAYNYCEQEGFSPHFYDQNASPYQCRFLINGSHSFPELPNLHYDYSASVIHGIGTKAGYYTEELNKHDIRFVEGEQRIELIKKSFPDTKCQLFNVGFAKLDEAYTLTAEDKNKLLEGYKLDPTKQTILYAPTFYPSSIDNMPNGFPADFADYNIIIKPHFFSFEKKTYKYQVRKFNRWAKYSNVFLAGPELFNLVPFMTISDIMISDESSAIFEFAALNKPVILNQNVRYRWSYRLFKSKIRKRMDNQMNPFKEVAQVINNYKELKPNIQAELKKPERKAEARKKISEQIVGLADGHVSERIVSIMNKLLED
ncbi:CDP-glycerol glycerophosphotransferase family protein [Carboxylicivirga sediminis]|uniref:CDP-glycerol glycerophosphotransferase family protein n=1 Tax=Carboxylicivirga sediminis TaxID=2006564 RepID=A0A941IXM0_9BACT|nr:CDP-glycerol glycerophosphotransferase family protein [Carboxylicivirga sediminis]MBR8535529.1 CDP-glycerol glycerophosphotransferase family protein [Carboxylicivirga sediminis]